MLGSIIEDLLIFATRIRYSVPCDYLIKMLVLPFSSLHQIVEVGDVGLVMLSIVVVECLHGQCFAETVSVVRKLWKNVAHLRYFN